MDFGLTEEQDQLAAAERAWLTKNDPIARVRATLDAGAVTVDPVAVAHVVESGLLELLTPEIGGTHVDLAVVTEEHGYAMSSLPVADLNMANAAMAVTKWKKLRGFYADDCGEHHSLYTIATHGLTKEDRT